MSRRGVLSVYTPLSVSEFSHYAPALLAMSISPGKEASAATGRKRRSYGSRRSERRNQKKKAREEERSKRRRSSAKGSSKAKENNGGGKNVIPSRQEDRETSGVGCKKMDDDEVETLPGEDVALDIDNVGSEFDFDEQVLDKKNTVHHSNKDTYTDTSIFSGGESDDESPVMKPRKLYVSTSKKRKFIQDSDDETATVEGKQTGSSRSKRGSAARKSKRLKQQTDDWDATLLAHKNGAEVEEDEFTMGTVEDAVLHEEPKPKRKKGRKGAAKKTPKENTPTRSSTSDRSTKKQVSNLKTGSTTRKSASVAPNRGRLRNKFVANAYAEAEPQDTTKDSHEEEPIAKHKSGRDKSSSRPPKKNCEGVELSHDKESDEENEDSSDDASEYEPTQKNSRSVSPKQRRTSSRLKTKGPTVKDRLGEVVDKSMPSQSPEAEEQKPVKSRNDSSDEGSEDESDEEQAENHRKSSRRGDKKPTKQEHARKRMPGKTRGETKAGYEDGQPRERTIKSMRGGKKSRKGDRIAEDEETVSVVSKTPPNAGADATCGKANPKVDKPRDDDSDDEISDGEKQDVSEFEIFEDNVDARAVGADDDDVDDDDDDEDDGDADAKFPLTQADPNASQFLQQSFSKSTDHSEDEASNQSKIEDGGDDKRAVTKHFKSKKAVTEADGSSSDDQAKASKLTPKISNGTHIAEFSTKPVRGLKHQDLLKEVKTQAGSQSEEEETQDSSVAPESFEVPKRGCVEAEMKDHKVRNHGAVAANDAKSEADVAETATEKGQYVNVNNIEEPFSFDIDECSDVPALNSRLGWHLLMASRCQQRIAVVNTKG